jgi:hypothetical protein
MDEGQSQEVELTTEEGSTGFVNVYYEEFPANYAVRADIYIAKLIRFKDGSTADVNDTFYAGVFLDEAGENLLSDASVVELKNNVKYDENETEKPANVEVPLGGETGTDPVTYYVYETDENGVRIDESDFAYTITFDAPSVELKFTTDPDSLQGVVTITNTEKEESLPEVTATPQAAEPTTYYSSPEETVTATPTATPAPAGTSGNSSTSSSVRTGDDTPIALYLCMAAVAALAGVGAMYMRKRRRR